MAIREKVQPGIGIDVDVDANAAARSRQNEIHEGAAPRVPSVDLSHVGRQGATEERGGATPSYGADSAAAEAESVEESAREVAEDRRREDEARKREEEAKKREELDERARSDMREFASVFGMPSKRVAGRVELSDDDMQAARTARAEDTPLPNESTRRRQYDPNTLALGRIIEDESKAGREAPVGRENFGSDREYEEYKTDMERQKRYDEAASEAVTLRKRLQKRYQESGNRMKPSIYERAVSFIDRRKEQFATDLSPSHRPREIIDKVKKRAKERFNGNGTGYRIYGKMVALPTLDLREIGVGIEEIEAVIEQDPTMLDNLLKASLSEKDLLTFRSARMMRIGDVADLINRNNVEVFTCKPPDNRGQDMQRRRLKVLEAERRGIYLHPSMAAMYTADYDGDDMQISLDPSVRSNAKDPMEQLVGVDGEQSLDTSFLHVSFIRDGWDDGKNARDYVREVILYEFDKMRMDSFESNAFTKVIDSVVELSRTAYMGSDEQAVAWGDFFRAARAYADARAEWSAREYYREPSARSSNQTMSDMVTAVCNGFRNVTAQTTIMTIGDVVPRDWLPDAFTAADSALYSLIDGMVLGAVPNNFQELKVMMNGFLGNVSGKSAPFRFTADVGKMMKLDTRFMINDTEYEYDPDDEDAMTDLLQKTVKYAYSSRMAVDIKANGKQMTLMDTVKRNVIKEVGFIDDVVIRKDADGNDVEVRRYANVVEFLTAFIDSYNHHAAVANEANIVWLSNMGIAVDTSRKAIRTIKNTRSRGNRYADVRFTDIATPFIDVYGNYSFNRMFGRLQLHDATDGGGAYYTELQGGVDYRTSYSKYNKSIGGNRDWGVSGGQRWVRGVYGPMSLKAFSVSNRIVRTKDAEKNMHLEKLFTTKDGSLVANDDAMGCLIAAIADKRTSTSSNYNTKVPGSYRGNNGNRGHVSTETYDGSKTVVGNVCEILKDIRDSDYEGTLLMPGFYAGIGSREAPQEVLDMATEIAKELGNRQFCLRSGHANGMDMAFEMGAGGNANIYLPYKGFNTNKKRNGMPVNGRAILFEEQSETDRAKAEESVLRYHPTGKRLRENYELGVAQSEQGASKSEYGKMMFPYEAMRRNYFQVFGTENESVGDIRGVESAFVVCFDDHGGGTAQAIRMAQQRNIPVFNAADYENLEDWKADVLEAADKALRFQLYRTTSADQMLHIDDAVMAINASGYELYHDLNMDSTAGFLMSEYGRAMIAYADNADIVAGIRAAMVFRQQTMQLTNYAEQIREADLLLDTHDVTRSMYLRDQYLFAKDELCDKSLVWRGIIQEMYANNSGNPSYQSAFVELRKKKGNRRNMEFWNANDFWGIEDKATLEKYKGIRDVIEDLYMPWPLKCDIITDVVRWQLNDPTIQPFEIMYQMEVGSDSRYSVNSSSGAVMQVWKDTNSASNRYANKSLRNARNEVKSATDLYRGESGALKNTIHNLATNPHLLVHIEDETYADAILAVRDKLYPQTEKSKKHPWTNYIYKSLMYQRVGGFFNDVFRLDDRLLGLQHKSQIGPADVLKLLDDPNYFICVYDDYGSVNYLDGQGLLGIDHEPSEREIWDWLNENPRIAVSILRQGVSCCPSTTEADSYVGSLTSVSETIGNIKDMRYDTLGNVKYLMRDHPVYGGIISLLNPAHGTTTRSERSRVPKVEQRVCAEIYSAAKNGYSAHTVMQNLGITRQRLLSLLVNDYDKYMARLGFGFDRNSIGEARDEASDIYDTIMRHLENYIDEVSKNVRLDAEMSMFNEINSFRNENYFLSNMRPTKVTYKGVTYKSAEAAFQAQKCANERDKAKFADLTGKQARSEGRKVKLRDDWESVKVDVMRDVVRAKFSDKELAKKLVATGYRNLVEGNTWNDTFWGVSGGIGENQLGKILMEVREELRQEMGEDSGVNDSMFGPMSMDIESLASFWDTIQELSGAKVGVSTGIEGSETYRMSYWVSHMGARDEYADLEAIEELITNGYEFPLEFDGAWTNKGPLKVDFTDDGGWVTNLSELKGDSNDEIVVKVPENFQVPDRSTDSYGKQVPSLYVSMVSKRANGAEKFNLKAMKAGLDGTDSITKMRNKYLTETYEDDQGNTVEGNVLFFLVKDKLKKIADESGIDFARMELARMMMEQDREMGYKDLTLANYMSIANVMLIECEPIEDNDGETIMLRSIEQLVAAAKNRIGCRVDSMTSKDVMDRVRQIVYDTTSQGVGISATSSQYELLSELRPFSASSGPTSAIREQSSVWSRNYDLLKQIERDNGEGSMLTETELREIHSSIIDSGDFEDITDIWKRSKILRNYNVIGCYGSEGGNRLDVGNIGPSSVIMVGAKDVDSKRLLRIMNSCYRRGVTVVVSAESVDSIPDEYIKDAIPVSEYGDMMIPMFDMRLNGSESKPFVPQFAIFKAKFGRYIISAEDRYNVFNLGDAQYKFTRALVSRLKAHDSGNVALTAMQLFPNVFKNTEYRNCTFEVGMANRQVIEDLLLSRDEDGNISPRCTIDYGLVEGANGWDQRVHDVNAAIRRYAENLSRSTDQDGVIRGVDLKPGDVAGWAQINIMSDGQTTRSVLAPLIPFQLSGANKVPETYTIVQAGKDNNDGSLMSVDWSYTRDLASGYIKYFDSSGGANKGMISLTDVLEDPMRLKNGFDMGAYCAAASTDSRKIGTDRRIKTMISLMAIARMTGYNFARSDGSFPDNPEIKEALSNQRLSIDFWADYYGGSDVKPIRFCHDREMSAFLNHECKKIFDNGGNPSDYLGTTFTGMLGDQNANEHIMWEFECMFENSLSYEDMLLRYLNFMMPGLCPSGIDDASEDKLFRLYRENGDLGSGFDMGMLQMEVPYPTADGRTSYIWSNVYVGMSFFGEDWSGNSRPNVRGASDTLDAENTNSYYGMELSDEKFLERGIWSTADQARPPADCGKYSAVLPYAFDWIS